MSEPAVAEPPCQWAVSGVYPTNHDSVGRVFGAKPTYLAASLRPSNRGLMVVTLTPCGVLPIKAFPWFSGYYENFSNLRQCSKTVTYGLFFAAFENIRREEPLPFMHPNLLELLPVNVHPVRALFQLMPGHLLPEALGWIIEDLMQLLAKADLDSIAAEFAEGGIRTNFYPCRSIFSRHLMPYSP